MKIITNKHITWNSNFEYQNSRVCLNKWQSRLDKRIIFKWKVYLLFIPFLRLLFNKELTFEKYKKGTIIRLENLSQIDVHRFSLLKKKLQ